MIELVEIQPGNIRIHKTYIVQPGILPGLFSIANQLLPLFNPIKRCTGIMITRGKAKLADAAADIQNPFARLGQKLSSLAGNGYRRPLFKRH